MESSAFVYTENESGLGVMPVNDSLTAHMGRYDNDIPKRVSSTGKKTRKPRVLKPAPNRPGPVLTTQPVQQSVAKTHPYKKAVKTGGKKIPKLPGPGRTILPIKDTSKPVVTTQTGQPSPDPVVETQPVQANGKSEPETSVSSSLKNFYEGNKTKVLIGGGIAGTLLLIKFLR